jgi:hypothetical protein
VRLGLGRAVDPMGSSHGLNSFNKPNVHLAISQTHFGTLNLLRNSQLFDHQQLSVFVVALGVKESVRMSPDFAGSMSHCILIYNHMGATVHVLHCDEPYIASSVASIRGQSFVLIVGGSVHVLRLCSHRNRNRRR